MKQTSSTWPASGAWKAGVVPFDYPALWVAKGDQVLVCFNRRSRGQREKKVVDRRRAGQAEIGMPAGGERQGPVVAIDAAYVDGDLMAGEAIFHLDGETVGITLEIRRQYFSAEDKDASAIFLKRLREGEGQGSGKSVEDEGFVGKHLFNAVRLPAKTELAIRNAIGEGCENAVSHAVLRLQFGGRRISVDKIFAFSAIGRDRPPAQKRRALKSDFGNVTVSGNGQTGNPRACRGGSHREIVLCMHLR